MLRSSISVMCPYFFIKFVINKKSKVIALLSIFFSHFKTFVCIHNLLTYLHYVNNEAHVTPRRGRRTGAALSPLPRAGTVLNSPETGKDTREPQTLLGLEGRK